MSIKVKTIFWKLLSLSTIFYFSIVLKIIFNILRSLLFFLLSDSLLSLLLFLHLMSWSRSQFFFCSFFNSITTNWYRKFQLIYLFIFFTFLFLFIFLFLFLFFLLSISYFFFYFMMCEGQAIVVGMGKKNPNSQKGRERRGDRKSVV